MPNIHLTKVIVIISLLVALGPLATDMYLPAFPTLMSALDASAGSVQLTLSIYFFGFAIGQLIYGPLSDRFGRKPILQIGLGIFVLSSFAIAYFVTSIEGLVMARLLQALGGCAGPVLGRAMVRDMFSAEESGRVLSHVASSMALAPAIAPIIGGYLTVLYSWQANFWFLFCYGIIALLTLTLSFPETNQYKNPDALKINQLWGNYCQIFNDQQWRLYTLISSFIFTGLFAFLSSSSFVLIQTMGVLETNYAKLFTIIVIGYMIGSQISARLSQRFGYFKLITIGSWIALCAGLGVFSLSLFNANTVASIVGFQFFFTIALGMVLPLAMAGALNPFPQMAGSASALLGFIQMMIASTFGVVISAFDNSNPMVMSGGIALAGVMTYLMMIRLKNSKELAV